jgi:hypothetical protein
MRRPALAITDHNNLSAAVRFHRSATAAGVKPVTGAEVTFAGGYHLTLLAQHGRGYANLCRLLTEAHLSQPRLQPAASLDALRDCQEGLIALSGCWRGEIATRIREEKCEEAEAAARPAGIFAGANARTPDLACPGRSGSPSPWAGRILVLASSPPTMCITCAGRFLVHDVPPGRTSDHT